MNKGEQMEQRRTMSPEEAEAFVSQAVFDVPAGEKSKRACVDGRYNAQDAREGALAVAGGDIGLALAVLATLRKAAKKANVDLASEKGRKLAAEVVVRGAGGAENVRFHTDDHRHSGSGDEETPESELAAGCGHFSKVKANPGGYDL